MSTLAHLISMYPSTLRGMIHVAVGFVVVALTLAALCVVSLLVPDAPDVGGTFVAGTVAAVATSGALLWYVRRERL